MIITKSISRFSRNTVDCLKYTRKLKGMNIAVFFEKENINTLDAKGEVLMTIMAALAQQESESLSANVRLGIQFRNWGALGDSYVHGFGTMGHMTGVVDFHHFWLKMYQAGKVDRIDDYSINLLACEQNKFMRATDQYPNSPLKDIGHAFHVWNAFSGSYGVVSNWNCCL